jgi:hypothetical protein
MVKPPPENTCAWCDEFVDEDMEIHAIGAKFPSSVNMEEHEGTVIFLGFKDIDKKVPAIISTSDSEARKHGHDLMFLTCSQSCFKKLKSLLDKEDDLLDVKPV